MKNFKSLGLFTFGEVIPGLMIHGKPAPYPVLNERAIRAGAGMVFAAGFFAFFQAFYLQNFIFLIDFFMKVVVGTKFSPISRLAALIVRGQKPEYVGAVQKRFAWSIGLILSATMVMLLYVFEMRGAINLSICSLCLTFMFMESAFGICVGCKMFNALMKMGLIKTPEHKPACPGNVCTIE